MFYLHSIAFTHDHSISIFRFYTLNLSWICCLTSKLTIFQSYMWRHIDVQADWRRSWTYGQSPNAIDISLGSLTCPSKHRHGTNLFIRWFRHTAPISRLLRHAGDTEDTFSTWPRTLTRALLYVTVLSHQYFYTTMSQKIERSVLMHLKVQYKYI